MNLTVSLREGAAGTPAPVTVTLPKGDEDGMLIDNWLF